MDNRNARDRFHSLRAEQISLGNRTVWGALVVMGAVWVIAQVVLVRELLVVFHGSERVVGLALGAWLLGGALGSACVGHLADRIDDAVSAFAGLQIFLAAALPAAVLVGRTSRPLAGLLPGELAGVGLLTAIVCAVLLPVGAACGGLFAAGCRLLPASKTSPDRPVGAVYATEAVGSILGGVFVTFVLIPHLRSLQIALLVSALCLAVALLLVRRGGGIRGPMRIAALAFLCLGLVVLLSPMADRLHDFTRRIQWGYRDVVFDRNSAYGNVAVLAEAGQYTFLSDGVPIATTPVPDIAAVEERAHLPLLFHPAPDTVLLIGGGIGGMLPEVLKHPVRHVDYVELDPLLFDAVRTAGDAAATTGLADARVRVLIGDGRRFVRQFSNRYDVVILSHPPGATLSHNRFYTRGFFEALRRAMRAGGVVAVPCLGSATYLDADTEALNAILRNTLQAIFPYVRIIPGEVVLFLASDRAEIKTLNAVDLSARFAARGISARLMSDVHLKYKLDPRKAARFETALAQAQTSRQNTDLMPVALVHALGRETALASPQRHAFFRYFQGVSLVHAVVPLAVVVLVLFIGFQVCRPMLTPAVVLGVTGFVGMAMGVALLMAYQTFYGALYRQMGLFTAAAALGFAVGGWGAIRLSRRRDGSLYMIGCEIALILTALFTLVAFENLATFPPVWGQAVLLALNIFTGMLVGAQFPLATRVCIRDAARVAAPGGALYAADLLGACVGALCVSAFMIPALGLVQICVLAAIMKFLTLILLAFFRRPG